VTSPAVEVEPDEQPQSESVGTVVIAGAANLAIALAKAVAGVLSGSAAMLSEAAHSVADTSTEVLLFTALRRGQRPADERHELHTVQLGPEDVLVAARVDFADASGAGIEAAADEAEERVRRHDPFVRYLFLDPTRGRSLRDQRADP
jgi:hypothetical protein